MIGPHFWFDLIRLPRKGWSTFFRCLYLIILLLGLGVMYESRRHTIVNFASYAAFANTFAYTLIVLQDILVLVMLPVYVGSAIAEERENLTLEALFITPLTDRQIVLGKFGGRFLHLMALILAGVPLLAFMHLWGNVPVSLLAFHTLNTVLVAMSASSLCILVSSRSTTVFQAVTSSFPWVLLLGFISHVVAYTFARAALEQSWGIASLAIGLLFLAIVHAIITRICLLQTIKEMQLLRNLEVKPTKEKARSFTLSDEKPQKVKMRKGRAVGSYIHRLALPIREPALFWKECLKDGTTWSLTFAWFGYFVLGVAVVCLVCQPLVYLGRDPGHQELRALLGIVPYTSYFVGLAAYFLVVVFQTTVSVAGERERNTLEFLLLIPAGRHEIFVCKWLGPLWKNWPILAISFLGVMLGLGSRVYSVKTALVLLLIPWPFLLMCSFLGILLSVVCQRTLYANIVMVGFLMTLLVAHFIGSYYFQGLFPAYGWLMFEFAPHQLEARVPVTAGVPLVLMEQGAFLGTAAVCAGLAYWRFHRTDYQGKM
jgi:ABC-type transport system involved in multi-copper enzyme maturation permease subunit